MLPTPRARVAQRAAKPQNTKIRHRQLTRHPVRESHDNQHRLPFFRDDVEFLPDLQRLEFVLQYLPDEELLRALSEKRGRGRDDFPVEAIWRAWCFGIPPLRP